MKHRRRAPSWTLSLQRSVLAFAHGAVRTGSRALGRALQQPASAPRQAAAPAGLWRAGVALGAAGACRYRLYRPPGVRAGERLPLLVMLHGCGQDAESFAACTRMNAVALRERFLVLYPEQDRLANAQGCWNWFDTENGRADKDGARILQALEQVLRAQPVDAGCVAIAGLSAGASMAALLAAQQPARFQAVVMHSGIPPGTAHTTLTALAAMRGRRGTRPLAALAEGAPGLPPLLVIHGDGDRIVDPANGRAAAQAWADAAGATAGAARMVRRGRRYPAQVVDFKHRGRLAATRVDVQGLGHAWSGGAGAQAHADARGPDASRMVWSFAARQFARQRAGGRASLARAA